MANRKLPFGYCLRNGQVRDVFIDMAGSACFLLLWGTAYYFFSRRRGGEK